MEDFGASFIGLQSTRHDRRGRCAWVFAKSNHLFSFVKARAVIESENASSDCSDSGQRMNRREFQAKVLGPAVGARIEKARELTSR